VKRLSRGQKYNNFTSGVDAYSRGHLFEVLRYRSFWTIECFLQKELS